jgi:hypothetical protein
MNKEKTVFRTLSVSALLVCVLTVRADVESGPKVGDKIEPLTAFGVVGAVEGKEVDYAKERKDAPTIYLFIQRENFSRPMARFMKTLDTEVKDINDKAEVVAVFLTDKPDDAKEHLPKVQMSLKLANTAYGVFTGEKSGPNGWAINTDAHITVTVANKAKVAANYAFQTINDTDVKKITEALKKAVEK